MGPLWLPGRVNLPPTSCNFAPRSTCTLLSPNWLLHHKACSFWNQTTLHRQTRRKRTQAPYSKTGWTSSIPRIRKWTQADRAGQTRADNAQPALHRPTDKEPPRIFIGKTSSFSSCWGKPCLVLGRKNRAWKGHGKDMKKGMKRTWEGSEFISKWNKFTLRRNDKERKGIYTSPGSWWLYRGDGVANLRSVRLVVNLSVQPSQACFWS